MPRIGALAEAAVGGTSLRRLAGLPLWRGALVLGYHRIADGDEQTPFDPGLFSATPATLDAQIRFIKQHFEVVSPNELEDRRRSGRRAVVVTFDDGYRDNYELAFPVLRRHGVPAAFFLATGFLDRPGVAWWDELAWMVKQSTRASMDAGGWLPCDLSLEGDERAAIDLLAGVYKSLPTARTESFLDFCAAAAGTGRCPAGEGADLWMTWDMAAELQEAGMVIGGHSVTHPILARSDEATQRREIEGCRQRLWDQLGAAMELFAYPVGIPSAFDDVTRRLLRAAGVRLAFSLYGGHVRSHGVDRYDVPRASVSLSTGEQRFRAALTLPQAFARW
jgi:peptidoglycan/xylan/chitin deacetylase (PgdA/CDA1 family)